MPTVGAEDTALVVETDPDPADIVLLLEQPRDGVDDRCGLGGIFRNHPDHAQAAPEHCPSAWTQVPRNDLRCRLVAGFDRDPNCHSHKLESEGARLRWSNG